MMTIMIALDDDGPNALRNIDTENPRTLAKYLECNLQSQPLCVFGAQHNTMARCKSGVLA